MPNLLSGYSSNTPSGYSPAYGGIPQLPAYDTSTSTTLGTDVNAQLIQNLPGYQNMVAGDSANIQSNLAGNIPDDVIKLMQQQAAERGVQTGMPGAGIGNAAYLRALGLTSLQLENLGHSQLTEAMQRTPIQQSSTTTSQHSNATEQAILNAAPNPKAAAEQALKNAIAGMGSANPMGGGGYTLNSAAPTALMGYQPPATDPNASAYAWQNAWNAAQAAKTGPASYPGMTWNPATGTYDANPWGQGFATSSQGGTGSGGGYSYSGDVGGYNQQLYDEFTGEADLQALGL